MTSLRVGRLWHATTRVLVSTQTPGKARFGAPVEPSTQLPRRQAVPNEKKRRSPSPSETPAYANRAAGARLSADELAVATRLFFVSFFLAFARQMWLLPLALICLCCATDKNVVAGSACMPPTVLLVFQGY